MEMSQSWQKKYKIVSKLGHGGNGDVFQVKRMLDGESFALK